MTLSLRMRVLAFVALINVLVFGAGLAVLNSRLDAQRKKTDLELEQNERALSALMVELIKQASLQGGDIRARPILSWPIWRQVSDAVIVGRSWDSSIDGTIQPKGAFLNPLGREVRDSDFDMSGVLDLIETAVIEERQVRGNGGLAIPVTGQGGVWGGCWFALPERSVQGGSFVILLPWFLGSTLLLTLGTVFFLRRFVLDPVEQLAGGARRISGGDFRVRLDVPSRRDELAELIRVFNAMASQMQGYNARLAHDVEIATEKVRKAETAAMTQRRLAAMGELAAGIAHEINNPLGGLMNAVDTLAKEGVVPERRRQYRTLLMDGLERIRATVGQLLRFTPRQVESQALNVVTPVADAIALVRHRADQMGVEIFLSIVDREPLRVARDDDFTSLANDVPLIQGEQNELGQAVLNLLVNALDALESETGDRRIDVRVAHAGDQVAIVVEDDGPGLAPEQLDRAADLFFSTKEVGKGTGLGLAIVHNVAATHGGRVELASELGRFFRATLWLPIAEAGGESR